MAAEDFSYYLERVPGAYFFMGNGPSAGLHHPAYDFADDAIAPGRCRLGRAWPRQALPRADVIRQSPGLRLWERPPSRLSERIDADSPEGQ